MKSLYEELNGSYFNAGSVKVPALILTYTNYKIGFWEQRHKVSLNSLFISQSINRIHFGCLICRTISKE